MKMTIVRVNQCFRVERWFDWMAKPLTGYKIEMQREESRDANGDFIAGKRKPAKQVKVPCKCYVRSDTTSEVLFYAGMLDRFLEAAKANGFDVNVVDGRDPNPMQLVPDLTKVPEGLRYKQEDVLTKIINSDKGIINCTVGFGKCLKKDTPVICYDGSIKLCQDVRIGDLLMGPDSTPRAVVALDTGVEPLYTIIPTMGDPFTVTVSHQLTMSLRGTGFRTVMGRRMECGTLFELPVSDYLKLDDSLKGDLELVRASAVEFPAQPEYPPLDPYYMGTRLGDDNWGSNAGIQPRYLLGSRQERLQVLAGLLDTCGYVVAGCMYEIITEFDQLSKDILFLARSLGFAAYSSDERKGGTEVSESSLQHRITISGDCSVIPLKVAQKRVSPGSHSNNALRVGFNVTSAGDGEYFGFQVTGDGRYLLGDFTITHNSFLMTNLCLIYPTSRIVIATAARELVRQIYDELVKLLGANEVGLICGGTPSTEESKRVLVSTCASICRCSLGSCDFLFFDEVHNIGFNKTFDNLIENLGPARCFGFTASPERGDQALDAMRSLFGKVIATCTYQEATEHHMVTPMRAFMPHFSCTRDIPVSADRVAAERANYWRNKERNRWIATQAAEAAEAFPEEQMLITVKTLEHALMLMQEPQLAGWELIYSGSIPPAEKVTVVLTPEKAPKEIHAKDVRDGTICMYKLVEYSGVWGYECGDRFVSLLEAMRYLRYVDGGCPVADVTVLPVKVAGIDVTPFRRTKKQVSEQVAAFARGDIRRAIATSMIKEGGNFYQLSHIFRADGSTSEVINTQFPGRASRVLKTKPEAIIIDPYDTWNEWVRGRSEARKRVYKKHGWYLDI